MTNDLGCRALYRRSNSTAGDINTNSDTAAADEIKTMRHLLSEFIGYYVVTQHLMGSSSLVTREGVLIRVLSNAFVLREEGSDSLISCDYFSLKFFRALPYGERPGDSTGSCIPSRWEGNL